MIRFWSPSTKGFFFREVHGDAIPGDAVEITGEEHAALLAGQGLGREIVLGEDGRPALRDRPAPSPDRLAAVARARRDALLAKSDWLVQRHQDQALVAAPLTLTAQQLAELLAYRQALRDVPDQPGFPALISWPELPA